MAVAPSDFFEARSIDDVTVITLLDAAEYRRDRTKDIDLTPLIHRMGGPPPPPPAVVIWQQLRHDLLLFLETNKPRKLVFDFAGLDRIGYQPIFSTAMNSVYVAAKRCSEAFGCQWRLCGFTERTWKFYDISCFPTIFPHVHHSQSEAVAAFSATANPTT